MHGVAGRALVHFQRYQHRSRRGRADDGSGVGLQPLRRCGDEGRFSGSQEATYENYRDSRHIIDLLHAHWTTRLQQLDVEEGAQDRTRTNVPTHSARHMWRTVKPLAMPVGTIVSRCPLFAAIIAVHRQLSCQGAFSAAPSPPFCFVRRGADRINPVGARLGLGHVAEAVAAGRTETHPARQTRWPSQNSRSFFSDMTCIPATLDYRPATSSIFAKCERVKVKSDQTGENLGYCGQFSTIPRPWPTKRPATARLTKVLVPSIEKTR